MDLNVERALRSQQAILDNLFQLYHYDFSAIVGADVGADGRYQSAPLDRYWEQSGHVPFLFRVDTALAGFALVRQGSRITDNPAVFDVSEFFVLRKYRRRGIGARAAADVFDTLGGPWEVRQLPANTDATAFWRKVIEGYAGPDGWTEAIVDNERWRGPVQSFSHRR